MPGFMTWGGVALAVLGVLIAIAGVPDRAAGFGLGSDLIDTGATLIAGGLIVAALGQVLRALNVLGDRIDDIGLGLGDTRRTFNDDEVSEDAPMPLPRAATREAAAPAGLPGQPQTDPLDALEAEMRDAASPPPVARGLRPQPPQQTKQQPARAAPRSPAEPRTPMQPQPRARRGPEFDRAAEHELEEDDRPGDRREPRWLRQQQPQPQSPHVPQTQAPLPLQETRPPRAPAVAPADPRRRPPPAPAYDANTRRQPPAMAESEVEDVGSVVRSGIIGGMAYTLYSDGSIEAELPIGTVRFNSLSELQEHVKRAGAEADTDFKGPGPATPH